MQLPKLERRTRYHLAGSDRVYPAIVTRVYEDGKHVDVAWADSDEDDPEKTLHLAREAGWRNGEAYGTSDPPPEPPGGGN